MSSGSPPPAPPPVDYNPAMSVQAMASADKMAMFVGGQVQQTMLQTNMMNLMGMRMQMMQEDKLDAKLEIASMNYEARMQEAQWRHEERTQELSNNHVEALVDKGMMDQEQFSDIRYPYQWGSSGG